jgi:site-specific recombinase XerD
MNLGVKMTTKSKEIINWNENNIEAMAIKIANEAPELKDLNKEQLEQIAKIVITQRLTNELNEKANIANIDYKTEKAIFLMQVGHCGSDYTQIAYLRALGKLERFTKRNNLNILQLSYGQADDFIYSLDGSPNSKRLTIAAISSFYSYLERRNASIKNPIRGTKARPQSKTVKEVEIPDDDEMGIILTNIPDLEKMAIYIMAYRGLRVGALNKLKIWGTHYQSFSKGKGIEGELSAEILLNIKSTEFFNKTPFSAMSTNAIKLRVYRATMKLYERGLIKSPYSAHDFRHYYAVSEYKRDKDIYKLSKLLDHSNIAITQTYLKSLKFVV